MTTTKGEHTLKSLELALHRIKAGRVKNIKPGRKLSIAAVAEEAGVSRATVHNRYPEIAEQVRQLLNKEDRRLKEAKGQELQAERAKRKKLNDENRALRQKIAELVSKNAALEAESDHLRAIVENENVNLLSHP